MAGDESADVRAYDAAKRRLATGEDELIPATFADRLLDGENPVRVWREYRGLSIRELAGKVGMTAAYLADRNRRPRGQGLDREGAGRFPRRDRRRPDLTL